MSQKTPPPIPPAPPSFFVRWQSGWRGQSLAVIALLLGGIGGGLTIGTLIRSRPASSFAASPASSPASFPEAEQKRVENGYLGPDALSEDGHSIPDPGVLHGTELPETEEPPPVAPEPTPPPIPLPPPYTGPSPAWRRHAIPAPPSEGQARIALVIDDMGIDRGRSSQVVDLAGPLTLSYLPYAHHLPHQAAQAQRHGHELLVHMPMQPRIAVDPGPDALTVTLPLEEIQRRLRRNLGKFDGYVGINNHMGSQFTTWEAGMRTVIAELRARGLIWLDSRTSPRTLGSELARNMAIPYIDRDIFLDDDPSLEGVRRQLKHLEALAHRAGKGVAIGHPKDNTIAAVKEWLPTLPEKGLVLVPITSLVKISERSPPPGSP